MPKPNKRANKRVLKKMTFKYNQSRKEKRKEKKTYPPPSLSPINQIQVEAQKQKQ